MTAEQRASLQPFWQSGPWVGAFLPYSDWPLPENEKTVAHQTVRAVADLALSVLPAAAHVFLQTWKIALEGAAPLYEENIGHWLPSIGMGVWPLREPPRRLSQADAMDCAAAMLTGDEPSRSTNYLSYVSAGEQPAAHALDATAGTGLLFSLFSEEPFAMVAARTKRVFLPAIRDTTLQNCRFYMPLIDKASLPAATPALLETWMCGGHTYVRESAEDGGLLILSRHARVAAFLQEQSDLRNR